MGETPTTQQVQAAQANRRFLHELHHEGLRVGERSRAGLDMGSQLLSYYRDVTLVRQKKYRVAHQIREAKGKRARQRTGFEYRPRKRRRRGRREKISSSSENDQVSLQTPPADPGSGRDDSPAAAPAAAPSAILELPHLPLFLVGGAWGDELLLGGTDCDLDQRAASAAAAAAAATFHAAATFQGESGGLL
jgi:hypothetical protein